jgi:hypothetical protein
VEIGGYLARTDAQPTVAGRMRASGLVCLGAGLIRTVSAGEVVFLPRGNVRRFRNPGIQPAASRLQICLQEQSLTGGILHLP